MQEAYTACDHSTNCGNYTVELQGSATLCIQGISLRELMQSRVVGLPLWPVERMRQLRAAYALHLQATAAAMPGALPRPAGYIPDMANI